MAFKTFEELSKFKDSPFGQFWDLEKLEETKILTEDDPQKTSTSKLSFYIRDSRDVLDNLWKEYGPRDDGFLIYIEVHDQSQLIRLSGNVGSLSEIGLDYSNIKSIYGIKAGWKYQLENHLTKAFFDKKLRTIKNKLGVLLNDDNNFGEQTEEQLKKALSLGALLNNLKLSDEIMLAIIAQIKKELNELWAPVLEALANEIRKFEIIDEKYWNPITAGDSFSPVFTINSDSVFAAIDSRITQVDNLFTVQLAGITGMDKLEQLPKTLLGELLGWFYENMKDVFGPFYQTLRSFFEQAQTASNFYNAFMVGLYNGLIFLLADVIESVAFILRLSDNNFKTELVNGIKAYLQELTKDGLAKGIWKEIGDFFAAIAQDYKDAPTIYDDIKEFGEDVLGLVEAIIAAVSLYGAGKAVAKFSDDMLKRAGLRKKRVKEELEEIIEGAEKPIGGRGPKGFGNFLGKYSKRWFDIENAGGPILNLDWNSTIITKDGIDIVKKHVGRFEDVPANQKMIARLEKIEKGEIEITDWDKRYYSHELREYERYKNLGFENTLSKDIPNQREIWNNTHSATLEDFRLYELDENGKNILYHPEIKDIDFLTLEDRTLLGY